MHNLSSAQPDPGNIGSAQPALEALPDFSEHDPLAAGELALITRDLGSKAGAGATMLVLRDHAHGSWDLVSAWEAQPDSGNLPRPPSAGGFVGRVLESGRAAVEPTAAAAPVRTPDGIAGALWAGFATVPEPAVTLWIVESYARLVALCLHDPNVLDGLLAAARRDALTGCLSYGAIRQELTREIRRSARHGRSVSCCFIDLDRFKAVNDRHGHLHGSRVLANVAEALRGGVRDGDTLGRYGGDEFVAVLPDTDEAAAYVLAERLRARIRASQPVGEEATVDASIGVAQWSPGSAVEDLLSAADDALHVAKSLGGGVAIRATDLNETTFPRPQPGKRREH